MSGPISSGPTLAMDALVHNMQTLALGENAFRVVSIKDDRGDTPFLARVRRAAMASNLVVMSADISPERRPRGSKGEVRALYRSLVSSTATRETSGGHALSSVVDRF